MSQLTFDKAYAELEKIVRQVEAENIPLDELAAKVKEAKKLIRFCEEKLRGIEHELKTMGTDEEAA